MKRILALYAALLVGGVFVNGAAAQGPGPEMAPGQGGFTPSPYGWHPKLQQVAWTHGGGHCGKHNLLGRIFGKSYTRDFPAAQTGTLVFPNHPFVRSPRDFFMLDQ